MFCEISNALLNHGEVSTVDKLGSILNMEKPQRKLILSY